MKTINMIFENFMKLFICFIGLTVCGLIAIVFYVCWHEITHCIEYKTVMEYRSPIYYYPGYEGGISYAIDEGGVKPVKKCVRYKK